MFSQSDWRKPAEDRPLAVDLDMSASPDGTGLSGTSMHQSHSKHNLTCPESVHDFSSVSWEIWPESLLGPLQWDCLDSLGRKKNRAWDRQGV